jgi:hypothetical protein
VYIVPTNRWYIERTVWLIAGVFLLTGTALALWVHPYWAGLVILTGLASIGTGLTGFCAVGTVLKNLGLRGNLESPTAPPRVYLMQTDAWFLERRIYPIVGFNISLASVLSVVHSPWWLTFTGFVGIAMVWFAATGYCIMANGLYWLGAEPRLAPLLRAAAPHCEARRASRAA